MIKNTIKTYRTELLLTQETKEKLKKLALTTHKSNSQIVTSLIDGFDKEYDIYQNVEYIKSRENVFRDLARTIDILNKNYENINSNFNELRDSLDKSIKEVKENIIADNDKLKVKLDKTYTKIKTIEENQNAGLVTKIFGK